MIRYMNTLPLELENIILDYKSQLEKSESEERQKQWENTVSKNKILWRTLIRYHMNIINKSMERCYAIRRIHNIYLYGNDTERVLLEELDIAINMSLKTYQ